MSVRVRFAPSPTGHLHIGGARTALFNYLFARKNKGIFILRIEDTDEVRSTPESVGGILESLTWLGLDWDEGPIYDGKLPETEGGWKSKGPHPPYFQMQRAAMYKEFAETLLAEDHAYWCFCTPEVLEEIRRQAQLRKLPPKYDGRCRRLSKDEAEARRKSEPHVLRLKMPEEGRTEWNDLVHGKVSFENKLLDDFVLVKSSGIPTYNFACVLDDYKMEITHALRGDDHISNTPRQLQIYRALGWKAPELGHFSIILGPDGTRLSKRHGATSVLEYKTGGYLPEALRNYLALLGWSTPNSQDVFEWKELIEKFDLAGCQKSPATFDPQKLLWMNGTYLRALSNDELIRRAGPYLSAAGIDGTDAGKLSRVIALEKEKYKLLSEVPSLVDFFYRDPSYDAASVEKVLKKEGAKETLDSVLPVLDNTSPFEEKHLEVNIRAFCDQKGWKTSRVFHPVRVAVSGRTTGPSLFAMLETLGKPAVVQRVKYAAKNLAA
jgi:nondiscriminating glutamyl-tRNA synthetase